MSNSGLYINSNDTKLCIVSESSSELLCLDFEDAITIFYMMFFEQVTLIFICNSTQT